VDGRTDKQAEYRQSDDITKLIRVVAFHSFANTQKKNVLVLFVIILKML
jgi:hypothetical protein